MIGNAFARPIRGVWRRLSVAVWAIASALVAVSAASAKDIRLEVDGAITHQEGDLCHETVIDATIETEFEKTSILTVPRGENDAYVITVKTSASDDDRVLVDLIMDYQAGDDRRTIATPKLVTRFGEEATIEFNAGNQEGPPAPARYRFTILPRRVES